MQKLKVKGDVEGRKKCGMNWRQGKVFLSELLPKPSLRT
jgi:hypothetical protein